MRVFSATTRVTFGLVCLSFTTWLLAFTVNLIPDRNRAVVEGRAALCENVAWHCSLLASRADRSSIQTALESLVERNPDVVSAAIRGPKGTLWVSAGDHESLWSLPAGQQSTNSQMRVPVLAGSAPWGVVELRFYENAAPRLAGWIYHPLVALIVFMCSASFLLFFFYLRKMLQHLDPSRVIPRRVRATLDTLAEGLLVLDRDEQILLANRSFAETLGVSSEELTGRKASELPWQDKQDRLVIEGFPWKRAIDAGLPQVGDQLMIQDDNDQDRVLRVNAMPVLADDGQQRGALASFDDVTQVERSRNELRQMLNALSQSRDEIHRQNLELERQASRDPLTDCLNRRAFFTELDNCWAGSKRHDYPLSCIMVDLDHFKSINDTYGHQTGDLVLQKAAELLRADRRPTDLVCRFGGEEFCVVLPHCGVAEACEVAERIRESIETAGFDGVPVTASLGVSERCYASEPREMIEQADQCLYVAKRDGRNRVVRFDEAAERIAESEHALDTPPEREESTREGIQRDDASTISFHAVTGLVSALSYRDQATADHSRRVAELCVAVAGGLLSIKDTFLLETAALLHDIGKIGVPDAILLKPDRLTDEEVKVMNSHERVGLEIIKSTFANPDLVEIVRTYRSWFGGNPRRPDLPIDDSIPLSSRVLAIADAYDSMTSLRPYRQPLTREDAFSELRACAKQQFDPELVERFVEVVSQRDAKDASEDASKAAAISFGIQMEGLLEALDHKDLDGIASLANRLNTTAAKFGAVDIAGVATQLEQVARSDSDVSQLVMLTHELLDLCRLAQQACLNDTTPATDLDKEDTFVADTLVAGDVKSGATAETSTCAG